MKSKIHEFISSSKRDMSKTIKKQTEMNESEKGNVKPQFSSREYLSITELRKLSELNPIKSTADIIFQYAAIACAIALSEYFKNHFITVLCMIFCGARVYAMGMLVHEGLHFRLAKNKRANEIITKLVAWPIFINPTVFRKNHLEHHSHLHTHDDPEFERRKNKAWDFPMHPLRLILLLAMDVTGLSIPFFLLSHKGYVVAKENKTKKKFDSVRWVYYGSIIGLLTYFNVWFGFFIYWLIPAITWGNLMLRIRRISEHCGLTVTEELISRSRTTKANFLERTFLAPCNINYHNEHHLYPAVPYYNLSKLHTLLMQNNNYKSKVNVCEGYINVFKECTAGYSNIKKALNIQEA